MKFLASQEDSILALVTFSKSDDSYCPLFLSKRREDCCLKSCTSTWRSFGGLRLAGSRRPVVASTYTVTLRRRPVLVLGCSHVRSNLKFCHRYLLRVPAGHVFSSPHWSSSWTQCIALNSRVCALMCKWVCVCTGLSAPARF